MFYRSPSHGPSSFISVVVLLVLSFAVSTFVLQASAQCTGPLRVRKEVRDLSPDEWTAYKQAVAALASANDPAIQYDNWTSTHMTYSREGHNTPQFFPWHRAFTLRFENALRRMNPNVTLPYWVREIPQS
jgi:hypothetical protein